MNRMKQKPESERIKEIIHSKTQIYILSLEFSHFNAFNYIKPWPNGLASRRKLKTWVYLRFRLASRALALTCDDLRSLWSRLNLHASQSKLSDVH